MDSPPKRPSRTLSLRKLPPRRSQSGELRPRVPLVDLSLSSTSSHSNHGPASSSATPLPPSRTPSDASLETVSLFPRRMGRKRLRNNNNNTSRISMMSSSISSMDFSGSLSFNHGHRSGSSNNLLAAKPTSSPFPTSSSDHTSTGFLLRSNSYVGGSVNKQGSIFFRRSTFLSLTWCVVTSCGIGLLLQNVLFVPARRGAQPILGNTVPKGRLQAPDTSRMRMAQTVHSKDNDVDTTRHTVNSPKTDKEKDATFQTQHEASSAKYTDKTNQRADSLSDATLSYTIEDIKPTTLPNAVQSSENSKNMFTLNAQRLEQFAKENGVNVRKTISAYTEPALQDTVPGTGSRFNPNDDKDTFGIKPDYIIPLPRRTHTPHDLKVHYYPAAQTCHDLPGKLPVDRGLQLDEDGNPIVWNVGNTATPKDFPEAEADFCPVELDPFLPWVHDVFPSSDGNSIEFVAQNMRRCRTGTKHDDNVNRLVPQAALFQAISVQRINETTAQTLAPNLWQKDSSAKDDPAETTRYRLAPHAEADEDGHETRFICRFHMSRLGKPAIETEYIGETLSEYIFNYEFVNYRKNHPSLATPRGKDTGYFWASNLRFRCPVPDNVDLRQAIANGSTVLSDGTSSLHVDIVPIRTSVRYDELYLTEDQIGAKAELPLFDPISRWGPDNVLPVIEASGRWENFPICLPPVPRANKSSQNELNINRTATISQSANSKPSATPAPKPHYLVGCLWASAEFKTRGNTDYTNTDTLNRLQEWIEFHLIAGFDHLYVYDNSGAHSNTTSLEPVLKKYPATQVTRIDWPSTVCNNNKPTDNSPGERSSQYAAESSCLARFGPSTEWMASFDTDEYFVPGGSSVLNKDNTLKDVLSDVAQKGTNILSFRSSRGKLRMTSSIATNDGATIQKNSSALFLEAYNCDGAGSPKPSWADRAKKQIYRPDYVLHHYVHYSTVTRGLLRTYKDHQAKRKFWPRRYRENKPSEIFADELNQAVMVHTKSVEEDMTSKFKKKCRYDYDKKWLGCWVAYPWPNGTRTEEHEMQNKDGMEYNCHVNPNVETIWLPKLKRALAKRLIHSANNSSQFIEI